MANIASLSHLQHFTEETNKQTKQQEMEHFEAWRMFNAMSHNKNEFLVEDFSALKNQISQTKLLTGASYVS